MSEGLNKARDQITQVIEQRMNRVLDGEPDEHELAGFLGSLRAVATLTRRIADNERRALSEQREQDSLRATLNDADPDESNRIEERMSALQDRIDHLRLRRGELTGQLTTLVRTLQD